MAQEDMVQEKEVLTDRMVTPFILWTYLPNNTKYVDFPLFDYHQITNHYQDVCRYYNDERPLEFEKFREMCKGHVTEDGLWIKL